MKAHLLFRGQDLDATRELPWNTGDLAADLGLDAVWSAMAAGDDLVLQVARLVMLDPLTDPDDILYRQEVLNDALRRPGVVRQLYQVAGEGLAAERSVYRSFFSNRPEQTLSRSVAVLDLFVGVLRKLRQVGEEHAPGFRSPAFQTLFAVLADQLSEDYLSTVQQHLKQLRFRSGLLMSVRLGEGNQGIDYVLRLPREENRTFFNRVGLRKPTFSYTIPDRDENGFTALGELRDKGLDDVANAVAQSVGHVLSFFQALRSELAFSIGCLNLHGTLEQVGQPLCFPVPKTRGGYACSARGLSDVGLALRSHQPVVGSDIAAEGVTLVVVTGANQGGKSTFLRGAGLAQIMMQAGMFVGAEVFEASPREGVFTHFKREEDDQMVSGKFDEELSRMSQIGDHIPPGALLLCNESFSSTNEREGSEIGRQVINAMVDCGVVVVLVTHQYNLSDSYWQTREDRYLFLRAERDAVGGRSFRMVEGEPLPTSHGQDIYQRIFGRTLSWPAPETS